MKTGRRLSSYDTCTLWAVRCLDIARNKISMLYLRHRRYTNTTAPHRQSTPSILFVVILSTKEICTYWILGSRRPFCWERHSWTPERQEQHGIWPEPRRLIALHRAF